MIHLIFKNLQNLRPTVSTTSHVYLFSTSTVKPASKGSSSTDSHSLTISYLINSCGLSLESATAASRKLKFETTDQPDSVLNLLKTHGLSQTHIKALVTNRPMILLAHSHKTLKPHCELFKTLGISGANLAKILNKEPRILESDVHTVVEFFRANGFSDKQTSTLTMKHPNLYMYNAHRNFTPKLDLFKSMGFSGAEIAQMLSSEPYILGRSLENQIIPSVLAIKGIVGTDENVVKAIKAYYCILERNLQEVLEPNIAILINTGVPQSKVAKLIMIQPRSLLVRPNRFSEVVSEVKGLGFDPTNLLFVLAVRSMAVMSKSLWEHKLGVYCSCGLSQDEIISAFKLQPLCMLTSEKKIRKMMDFFVNELKLKSSMLSKNPNLLSFSLEKRIIPRCSVLQLLMSNDLIKGDISLVFALQMTENMFLRKFVSKYQHMIPEVVEAHQGKIKFQGFPIALKMYRWLPGIRILALANTALENFLPGIQALVKLRTLRMIVTQKHYCNSKCDACFRGCSGKCCLILHIDHTQISCFFTLQYLNFLQVVVSAFVKIDIDVFTMSCSQELSIQHLHPYRYDSYPNLDVPLADASNLQWKAELTSLTSITITLAFLNDKKNQDSKPGIILIEASLKFLLWPKCCMSSSCVVRTSVCGGSVNSEYAHCYGCTRTGIQDTHNTYPTRTWTQLCCPGSGSGSTPRSTLLMNSQPNSRFSKTNPNKLFLLLELPNIRNNVVRTLLFLELYFINFARVTSLTTHKTKGRGEERSHCCRQKRIESKLSNPVSQTVPIRPTVSTTGHVYLFSTSTVKPASKGSSSTDSHSLTISYLINSCGLSLESATAASRKLKFETTDQPDSVLNLLKTHGLTQTHIKALVTNRPMMLLAHPHKTLKPNCELFKTLGISGANLVKILNKEPRILESDVHTVVEFFRANGFREEIAQMLASDSEPCILGKSLENHIIPSVLVIRGIVGTDENVVKAMKAILECNLEELLEPNIAILINAGVPLSKVVKLIMIQPRSLLVRPNRFSEVVSEVKGLGFDPTNLSFVLAVRSMGVMSKSL
ncbi:unnamed protein product [Ilex paraguariensis]|uniref:Uncharacterized protein n=1 Tax=Ilex paraguariensis TaxID=185542 RepID=A0ABC8TIX3_9AQUA